MLDYIKNKYDYSLFKSMEKKSNLHLVLTRFN